MSSAEFQEHSAMLPLFSFRSCCPWSLMEMSRESSGEEKWHPLLLSWAGLWGHRELKEVGSAAERQLQAKAASLHRSAGLGAQPAGGTGRGEKGERDEGSVGCERAVSSPEEHRSLPLARQSLAADDADAFPGRITKLGHPMSDEDGGTLCAFVTEKELLWMRASLLQHRAQP